jgi:hypothetical protein
MKDYIISSILVKYIRMVPCLQAGAVRRRDGFAARYGLQLVFYTEGSLDSIKNFAVIPCAPIFKRTRVMPKPLKCASDPSLARASAPRHELRTSASPWRSQRTPLDMGSYFSKSLAKPGGENRRGAKSATLGRTSVFSKACQGWLLQYIYLIIRTVHLSKIF